MWRAFFAAVGAVLLILGGECLIVEKAVLASAPQKQQAAPLNPFDTPRVLNRPAQREVKPPEWAPWSLLSAGAVIMLYTFTLRRGGD